MRTTTKRFAAGAGRIHHWSGRAPAILALHGFTGSGIDFGALADDLGHQIAAPDLGAVAGGLDDVASALAASRARVLPGTWVLLGYSMGGRIALHMALTRPDPDLLGLVLVGATPGIADDAERAARRTEDLAMAERIEHLGTAAFAEQWERKPIIASQARIPSPWGEALRQRRRRADPGELARSLRDLGTGAMAPLWGRLGSLTVPTLLLTGEEDTKFSAIAEKVCLRAPSARHVLVAGAGHCAHLEQPAATARAITEFLSGLPAPTTTVPRLQGGR